ncbi:hypothetical protein GIX81_02840 [Lactobacillus reuteri]|uniref:Uncharacterized protein n=1 Tax=Limosilactobacillus reuteri TaxID=1598 RepID=A0A6L5P1Q2_LIMRT|nr:hypothetical protein [Limosilactobacillus reuteri]MRH08394.1 hypothetical protein [Limosilactobacillus reuteri]
MTLTKIVNSKLTAMLIGAWTTYCAGVGDYGGAVFLLFFYLLMLRSYRNKKSASAGDTSATKKIIAFRRRLYHE